MYVIASRTRRILHRTRRFKRSDGSTDIGGSETSRSGTRYGVLGTLRFGLLDSVGYGLVGLLLGSCRFS